ncbi:MAG: hydroxyethylthiazole kinase [Butyricicoccus sp.]|nr:hydroxyethylthiazole kinase [Butyricicoccus sp.]
MELCELLTRVRERAPLVQCITNFVTVNDCANILLAVGASPTMAEDIREVEEAVAGADGLVCNLGAIEKVDSMVAAGQRANALGKPVVFDPVAAGGTSLRRRMSARLLEQVHFAAIRGNASEIRGLMQRGTGGSGVDVSALDRITRENLAQTLPLLKELAVRTGSVIAVSGALDVVTDGARTVLIENGCPTMARITGSGCMLTTLIGAFCAAAPEVPFEATCAAMAAMGVCGELAEERRLQNGTGNAAFRTDLIDAVFNLTEEQLKARMRYEVYEG